MAPVLPFQMDDRLRLQYEGHAPSYSFFWPNLAASMTLWERFCHASLSSPYFEVSKTFFSSEKENSQKLSVFSSRLTFPSDVPTGKNYTPSQLALWSPEFLENYNKWTQCGSAMRFRTKLVLGRISWRDSPSCGALWVRLQRSCDANPEQHTIFKTGVLELWFEHVGSWKL